MAEKIQSVILATFSAYFKRKDARDMEISSFVSEFWNDFKNNHDKQFVDPISLYLTLKDDDDPRIEEESEALENMILQYLGEDDAS